MSTRSSRRGSRAQSRASSRQSSRQSEPPPNDADPPPEYDPPPPPPGGEDPDGIHVDPDQPTPSAPPSRAASSTRSRTSRRSTRAGTQRSASRVSINVPTYSQEEIDAAITYILSTPVATSILPLIDKFTKGKGSDWDVVKFAASLRASYEGRPGQARGDQFSDPPPRIQQFQLPLWQQHNEHGINNLISHAQLVQVKDYIWTSELEDRGNQRQLIAPPTRFAEGTSSLRHDDNMRFNLIKAHFSPAFSGKKFTGKRTPEGGIIELLRDFNNAQEALTVTRQEFLQYLTMAMSGDAHRLMASLFDFYMRGIKTIDNIYHELTDLYFSDLTPADAHTKLMDYTEWNHGFKSLSEAHNELLHLANLSSLSSRTYERQLALTAENYRMALLKIIPKDYKPLAISTIEACSNQRNVDLAPQEMLSCLSKIRNPVDELLRKTAKKDRGDKKDKKDKGHKVKQVKSVPQKTDSESLVMPHVTSPSQPKKAKAVPMPKVQAVRAPAKEGKNKRGQQQNASANQKQNKVVKNASSDSGCKLCGNPKHGSEKCPFYPQSKQTIAKYECRVCDIGLFHYGIDCLSKVNASKN